MDNSKPISWIYSRKTQSGGEELSFNLEIGTINMLRDIILEDEKQVVRLKINRITNPKGKATHIMCFNDYKAPIKKNDDSCQTSTGYPDNYEQEERKAIQEEGSIKDEKKDEVQEGFNF